MQKEKGLTYLFIAHDLSMVKYISVIELVLCILVKSLSLTTSEELYANPLHPYTQSLLSAIPLPDPDYERNRKRIVYDPSQHHYGEVKHQQCVKFAQDILYYVLKQSIRNIKKSINNKK